ncbi:oxidoreductase [Rhodanobacter sp. L36]|uniref:oxidoreductase n=1 Tax=Rhodanobacter sp. L36 TaxID=1747221 RepID=UPI001C201F90|nr:oxidoreductase [Rhodanobacter sp. L36]
MQTPLPSGFGPATTAADVIAGVDLTGKLAIVTGGYSGIGVETVRALRGAGAHVIVPARDAGKARDALAGIDAEILPMDLAAPASIDAFAEQVLARNRALHILINNAGVMACPLERDARGYERQFATNHLGHFQLAVRLWPALLRANGARVVALSSRGHRYAAVDVDDPHFHKRDYDRWIAYGQSKTATSLLAVGVDVRGKADGIRAFAVHPGAIVTPLVRHLTNEELRGFDALDENDQPVVDIARGMKSPQQGAATSVWAATSRQLDGRGAIYLEDCDIAPVVTETAAGPQDTLHAAGVRPYAIDPVAAEKLWALSEVQTGARLQG